MSTNKSPSDSFRFSFKHGIVGRDEFVRVTHMASCFPLDMAEEHGVPLECCMSQAEFAALDGQPAKFLGGRHFQVGRAVVEVQDGYAAPYGAPVRWEHLQRSA